MPMAISFVGASVIGVSSTTLSRATKWKWFAQCNPAKPRDGESKLDRWNTFLLIECWWIQTGFAMVILSAAMKNVPDEVVEAAMLMGPQTGAAFRVTLPMIRGTVVVVLTTIHWTLKVFDIVRTMTGGNFQTNVIANEMYAQSFRQLNYGQGSTLAVILFVAVIPIIWYNVRQLRLRGQSDSDTASLRLSPQQKKRARRISLALQLPRLRQSIAVYGPFQLLGS